MVSNQLMLISSPKIYTRVNTVDSKHSSHMHGYSQFMGTSTWRLNMDQYWTVGVAKKCIFAGYQSTQENGLIWHTATVDDVVIWTSYVRATMTMDLYYVHN